MYTGKYAPWDEYPKILRHYEVQEPLNVLKDFFSADWPKDHKKRLKRWRQYVISETYFNDKRFGPGTLLYQHELNIRLLEATYLLLLNDYPVLKKYLVTAEQITQERATWYHYPKNLSDKELLNPFNVIKKIFKDLSLPQYREHLNEWLYDALSRKTTAEGIDAADILLVYDNMLKLYSAAWLILQRSTTQPTLKKGIEVITEKLPECTPSKAKSFHEVALYNLDATISSNYKPQLPKIIEIIKHKVPTVQAVIYLGAIPNEKNEIFLLILTSDKENRQAQSISSTIEESCRGTAIVTAMVHHAIDFLSGPQNEHAFFNNALRCPVVYLSGDLLLPSYKTQFLSGANEKKLANWQHWSKQGNDFLKGAEGYLKREAASAALFSLHQCVECLLVAIIRVILGYRINNHNLTTLLRITRMFTGSLSDVFNLDAAEDIRLFELLKHAYVNVRYKDQFEPDINDVDTLYRVTKYFVSATEAVYQKHLLTSNL